MTKYFTKNKSACGAASPKRGYCESIIFYKNILRFTCVKCYSEYDYYNTDSNYFIPLNEIDEILYGVNE